MQETENDNSDSQERTLGMREFGQLSAAVIAIWLIFLLLAWLLFPDWATRGTFGDTFGAVNSLFSGLALAGVIFALLLQRTELGLQREELRMNREVMEGQLSEMRTARQTQSQPMVIPTATRFKIERPRFFYAPPTGEYSAQARYFAHFSIHNPTAFPAVVIDCRGRLHIPSQKSEPLVCRASDKFVNVLVRQPDSEEEQTFSFMFVEDVGGKLFDSLRQSDPRKVPLVLFTAYYRNVVGTYFQVQQIFRVYMNTEKTSELQKCHSAIASFNADHSTELRELNRLTPHSNEWTEIFESVESQFNQKLEHAYLEIELPVEPVPGRFDVRVLTPDEYREAIGTTQYGQRIIPGAYDCPADLDTR